MLKFKYYLGFSRWNKIDTNEPALEKEASDINDHNYEGCV